MGIQVNDLDRIFGGLHDPVDRDVYRLAGCRDPVIRNAEPFQNVRKCQYRFFVIKKLPVPTGEDSLCGYFLQKTSGILRGHSRIKLFNKRDRTVYNRGGHGSPAHFAHRFI